jgi:hypothetical protein
MSQNQKMEKLELSFLAKNITLLIQPVDQGMIRTFKSYYHGELLGSVVNLYLNCKLWNF